MKKKSATTTSTTIGGEKDKTSTNDSSLVALEKESVWKTMGEGAGIFRNLLDLERWLFGTPYDPAETYDS